MGNRLKTIARQIISAPLEGVVKYFQNRAASGILQKTPKSSTASLLPWIMVRILPIATILFIAMGYMASKVAESSFSRHFVKGLDQELRLSSTLLTDKMDAFKASVHAISGNSLIVKSLVDAKSRHTYLPIFFKHLQIAGSSDGEIVFINNRGRVLATNKPKHRVVDMERYKSVIEGKEYLQINSQGLVFAVPVVNDDTAEGMIIVRYNQAQTARLLSLGAPLYSALIHKDKTVLYSSNPEFTKLFKSNADRANWIERHKAVSAYSGISIIVAAPKATVLAGLYKIEGFMYVVMALSLLALAISIYLTVFLTSRPLNKFVDDINKFGRARDLKKEIETSGFAEIHTLGKSFNSMLQRMQQAVVSQTDLEAEVKHRKQVESRLREREERTKAIVENVLEGIITIDEEGIIRTLNPAACNIFGVVPEQVLGRNVSMLMPDSDRRKHDGYLRNYAETNQPKIIGTGREVTGRRKNGDTFPMELAVSPMTVNGRRMFTGVVRDITERKRVETLKNEFVSIVSHELRTPLTALIGSLSLVEKGALGSLPEKAQTLIGIAVSNSKRLSSLVDDILDIQKIESGKMEFNLETLDVIETARQSLAENEAYGDKYGVSFKLDANSEEIFIRGDRTRIMQVFNNLLSNAAKFSPEGADVILQINAVENRVKFAIIDNGSGIPEDMKDKVFENFAQVDVSDSRSKSGTGLGLGISQAIVEIHGSELKLESELGKGTTFYFDLPLVGLSQEPKEHQPQLEGGKETAPVQKASMLIKGVV